MEGKFAANVLPRDCQGSEFLNDVVVDFEAVLLWHVGLFSLPQQWRERQIVVLRKFLMADVSFHAEMGCVAPARVNRDVVARPRERARWDDSFWSRFLIFWSQFSGAIHYQDSAMASFTTSSRRLFTDMMNDWKS